MDNNMHYNENEEDEIDLGEFFRYMWKYALIIVLIGLAGALIGGGYAYLKNRSNGLGAYESSTSIYCDPVYADTSAELILAVQTSLMKDYCEFATSRTVIESAIDELGIDATYEDLKDTVSAEVVATQILRILVFDDDPAFAQKLASVIADATVNCIKLYSQYSTPNVLEEANLPTTRTTEGSKDVKKYALIGALGGIIIGCIIYGILYFCSDRILVEYDIERFLKLKILAVVKNDEQMETAINRIKQVFNFIPVELKVDNTELDDFIDALEVAKANEKVIVIVKKGMHGKSARKALEKIVMTGCMVEGAIFVE